MFGIMENKNMLILKNVCKDYADIQVLKGLDLNIPAGTIFGYIGPNGAGKTTTIRIMTGLMSDFNGDVIIDGMSIRENANAIKSKIGYLPQNTSFQDWRTLEQTLHTFGRLSGIGENELQNRIDIVLKDLGIEKYRKMKVSKLSGGTVQKAGMAQALLHRPKILILDEPMAALDPEARVQFKKLFLKLKAEGTTIFFSSHILSDIQDIADCIGILRNGVFSYQGTMQEFRRQMDGDRSMTLEVSGKAEQWQSIAGIEGVSYVELIAENKIVVHLDPDAIDETVSSAIVKHLVNQDCNVRSIQKTTRGLEDLYIAYSNGEVKV